MNLKPLPRRVWGAMRRRKITVAIAAWGLLVAILAFTAPSVTVAEQSPLARALPVVNEASTLAVSALSNDGEAFTVGALVFDGDCSITLVRSGHRYTRSITAHVDSAEVAPTAHRLAKTLKKKYPLVKGGTDKRPRYSAIVDEYVALELSTDDNTVTWKSETGCRPDSDTTAVLQPPFNHPAEAATAMDLLGVISPSWTIGEVSCLGDGGTVARTAWATGRLPDDADADIAAVVERLPGDAIVRVAKEKHVSYLWQGRSLTVSLTGRVVTASATQACPSA
ncbi:hypothetical protein STSO111631_08155 [Stackebrandtia soli]